MAENQPHSQRFGELAIELGLITSEQLENALQKQKTLRASAAKSRLGETLMIMNVLTVEQVRNVLSEQRRRRQAAAEKPLPMEHFGEYKLLAKLGEGGMGAVYKAWETLSARTVALKVLRKNFGSNRDFVERFDREAKLAAALNHQNIVACYTGGVKNGVQYMAMEYVDGQTLKQQVEKRGGWIPEKEALRTLIEVAKGLSYAHSKGIVHRDIKPDNILLGHDGSVKISDFGTAKSFLDEESLTQTGMIIGTPYYIAPEQVRAEKNIDHRADLYALGGTMYHCLTGQVPFFAPSALEIMRAHLSSELDNPRDINPEISVDAVRIVSKLMAKVPAERYQRADEVADDFQRVMEGKAPLHATLDENKSSIRPQRYRKNADGGSSGGCLGAVLLLAGAGIAGVYGVCQALWS